MPKLGNFKAPAINLLLPVAAIAPGALFTLMWMGLNHELPLIGEGFDTPGISCLAGFLFWSWIAFGRSHEMGKPLAMRVFYHMVAAAFCVPAGRVIFSILPPWSNEWGAVFGMGIGFKLLEKVLRIESQAERFVHARGTVMLTGEQAIQQLRALRQGTEPRIRWAGNDLPGEVAIGNLLTVGAIGTGKTRIHRELMWSVLPTIKPGSDRRALVYDVKCDFLAELEKMPISCTIVCLNPFDSRCVAWDIAADVASPDQARHFAEALILPGKGDENPFFTRAARAIVAGVINALNASLPGNWSLRDIIRVTASRERLEKLLAGDDLIPRYFSPENTFDNIRNTIANVMVELEPVAALWDKCDTRFSLRQWVKTGDSIVVLAGKENLQASLQPINRVMFKLIATEFLSEPESPTRARLWFFCDELKTAGRLDGLPDLLNARSKGVRCVLGFQDLEGIIDAYGSAERAKETMSRCATVAFLKVTSPDTADWASKRTGESERYEYMTQNNKDGNSVGEHLSKRDAVLPSEFLTLPDFSNGTTGAIQLVRGVAGVFSCDLKFRFPEIDISRNFQPRDESEQLLALWSDADEKRLFASVELQPSHTKTKVESKSVDLDDLHRVKF